MAESRLLQKSPQNASPDGTLDPQLTVIVPTRNERDNVGPLLHRVGTAIGHLPYEIIFVDDSDDGTQDELASLGATLYPGLKVIHREPGQRGNGLAGAITAGIASATGEYVAVLDADLQHPPEVLAEMMMDAASHQADIVIASRYVPGGSAAGLEGITRKAISRISAIFSRVLFYDRIRSVKDPCSGFFLVRRSLFEGSDLRPIGFKILLEILIRTPWRTLHETPYRFADRGGGASKATLRQGLLFLRHCLRLAREVPDVARLWKFALVGSMGLVISMLLLRFLRSQA